jgi:pimeloyl-ACP methyl ester carboxylesterase
MAFERFGTPVRMAVHGRGPHRPRRTGARWSSSTGQATTGSTGPTPSRRSRAAGYRVVVPDQLGWGRSTKAVIPYSLHLHAANTRLLLERLGVEEAAIVGHSMGGMLATRFALLYPDVTTHMVMVNPIGLRDTRPGRGWQDPRPETVSDLEAAYRSRLGSRSAGWWSGARVPGARAHPLRVAPGRRLGHLSYVRP